MARAKGLDQYGDDTSNDPADGVQALVEAYSHGEVLEDGTVVDYGEALTFNIFCPTGEGGGVDATCSPGSVVGAPEHAAADRTSNAIAKMLNGVTEELTDSPGQRDKKPYDVRVGKHDIEVKTLLKGKAQAITMHEDALLRKVEHAEQNPGRVFHTVVSDQRDEFGGGSEHYSGNRVYYKRGSGRYNLSQMHPVKSVKELKRLINAKDSELPEKAKGQLPPPPPVEELKEKAAKVSEGRKERDKARKERNKELLKQQARERYRRSKE